MIHNFPNWKFAFWSFMCTLWSTAGVKGSAGNCHQLLIGRQLLALPSAPAIEPRVLSPNTGKKRFQIRLIVGIYEPFPDMWMLKMGTKPLSSISGIICLKFSVQCGSRLLIFYKNHVYKNILDQFQSEGCTHELIYM